MSLTPKRRVPRWVLRRHPCTWERDWKPAGTSWVHTKTVLPPTVTLGNRVTIGRNAHIGECVRIGDDSCIGDCVCLGDRVSLGNRVRLGNNCDLERDVVCRSRVHVELGVTIGRFTRLGNDVRVGEYAYLCDDICLGNDVRLGRRSNIGRGVCLETGVRLGDSVDLGVAVQLRANSRFTTSPLQIQGTRHLCYHAGPRWLGIGCRLHELSWWSENITQVSRNHCYTRKQLEEYRGYLQLFIARDAALFPKAAAPC